RTFPRPFDRRARPLRAAVDRRPAHDRSGIAPRAVRRRRPHRRERGRRGRAQARRRARRHRDRPGPGHRRASRDAPRRARRRPERTRRVDRRARLHPSGALFVVPSLLLVDDRPQNLLALRAILEPLGHDLVSASSGAEALRTLLDRDDFAVILLDVQMPEMDGFEVAEVIKQRDRTSTIPIIFLTALSKEEGHVFRGYEVGAVDYVFKPFDPELLRAKVAVFVELWEKSRQIREQAEELAARELAELRRTSDERYRQLADAMPQIVWTSDAHGNTTYFNRRWFEYTGMSDDEVDEHVWTRVVHPEDLPHVAARRAETLRDASVFEAEYRFRAADGSYRWHLGRSIPVDDFWIGTATDIDDRKRIEQAQRFLLDAGATLSSSLDWRTSMKS